MTGTIGHQRFLGLLDERFPEIVATIDECAKGLLHLEMAALARATQSAIDSHDAEMVRRHFQFVDEVFRDAAPDVENAVYVSYLENLQLEGRKAGSTKLREMLPSRLQKALADLEAHLDRIFEKDTRV